MTHESGERCRKSARRRKNLPIDGHQPASPWLTTYSGRIVGPTAGVLGGWRLPRAGPWVESSVSRPTNPVGIGGRRGCRPSLGVVCLFTFSEKAHAEALRRREMTSSPSVSSVQGIAGRCSGESAVSERAGTQPSHNRLQTESTQGLQYVLFLRVPALCARFSEQTYHHHQPAPTPGRRGPFSAKILLRHDAARREPRPPVGPYQLKRELQGTHGLIISPTDLHRTADSGQSLANHTPSRRMIHSTVGFR